MMDLFSLSLAQEDIYFDQLHNQASPLYNIGGYIVLGKIDVQHITQSHARLVSEEDAFGLRIITSDEGPKQYIQKHRTKELPIVDFSAETDPKEAAITWIDCEFQKVIEFENCELFKTFLLKLSDEIYWYFVVSHHLMVDGWGFSNWAKKLASIYNTGTFRECEKGWKNIVLKEKAYLESDKYKIDEQYWKAKCGDMQNHFLTPEHHEFKQIDKTISSQRYSLKISREEFGKIEAYAKDNNCDIPRFLWAALAIYFAKCFSINSVTFGVPVHNRRDLNQKNSIGIFTSISPLNIELMADETFGDMLKRLSIQQRKTLRHQRFPIGRIAQKFNLRDGKESLYDVVFNYLKLDYKDLSFGDHDAEVIYAHHNHEKNPLTISVWDGDGECIELKFDYHLDYFLEKDIEIHALRIREMFQLLAANHEHTISSLSLCLESEKDQLLKTWNNTSEAFLDSICIHELFEHSVEKYSDNVALEF
ncbi:condensation domain-containing protein, partial [Pseudoalteromonas luteoviolacea]|uniref:condensation domain-containing protein n=1 Tax=Pseudoalteromonas luteoviolacea TaxID=43657 RepID=UPI001F16351A